MDKIRPIVIAVLLVLTAGAAQARDQFGGFKEYIDRGSLRPFTRDLGGILGSASFHSGRSLGISGFDVGVHGGMQFKPEADDKVLRGAGQHLFGLPWAQGEIGMPFGIDGFIRGVSYQGLTIAGGGLRWGITKGNDKPWDPNLLVSALAHSVTHTDFSASHASANLVASVNAPYATPYIGVGFDRTRVVVRSSSIDPALAGEAVVTFEGRVTAGVTVRPWKFIYAQAAYTNAHGQHGADVGLGLRF